MTSKKRRKTGRGKSKGALSFEEGVGSGDVRPPLDRDGLVHADNYEMPNLERAGNVEPRQGPEADPESEKLLAACRTQWQYGEWGDLASVDLELLETHRDRARLALLVAAAKSHLGMIDEAKVLLRRSLAWGCDRRLLARVMTSMAYNTLGRWAAGLEKSDAATSHFKSALGLVDPSSASALPARTRQIRETARMGLLPDAAKLLGDDLKTAGARPLDIEARLETLRTSLDLLGHELSLSLKRRQILSVEEGQVSFSRLASRSVSQLGQDLWVLEKTGHMKGGFFVEFGATDGIRLSNTFLLETEFGWKGICAEPNPELFEQLKANRRCITASACIAGRSGDEVDFILADAYGGISKFAAQDQHASRRDAYRRDGRVLRVTTVSLDDFLMAHNAPQEIDYLSIDTEGSEYEILKNFSFDRWKIRLITVEHNNTPQRELLRALLEPLGYKRTEAQWDDWYFLAD